MTVETEVSTWEFSGNGVTTAFAIPARFLADSDLVVSSIDSNGSESIRTLATHYTVSGAGAENGGTVTFLTAPASNTTILVRRVLDITQPTDIRNQGRFLATIHEDVFDRLTMIEQQQEEVLNRSLRMSHLEDVIDPIPAGSSTYDKFLYRDAAGDITWVSGTPSDPITVRTTIGYPTSGDTALATGYTYTPGSNDLSLYLNGVKQVVGVDYTETDENTVTLTVPATTGDIYEIDIGTIRDVTMLRPNKVVAEITATTGQTAITVPAYSINNDEIEVFFNGALLSSTDYVETNSTTVTLTAPCVAGDLIRVLIGQGYDVATPELTATDIGRLLYRQTAAEIAAGVTPTDTSYPAGDVRRYGTNTVPGTTDMAAAIQSALDFSGFVILEKGKVHQVSTAVLMDDSEMIIGYGRDTVIRGNLATGVIKARNGISSRSYYLGGRDFTVDNTSRATSGGIGLDMSGVTMGKWFNVGITNVEVGVKQLGAGAVGCFYNEYHACDINGVVTGYDNGTLANENKVFGGRVNDCATGTIDDDNSCNTYVGLAIEAFTLAGHNSSPTAPALLVRYIGSRLENLPTSGTGILIGATAQDTFIEAPYFTGLTTDINDAGSRTTVLMPRGTTQKYLQFNGGTAIAKYLKVAVVRDVASLGAATARQEGPFTVTGCAVGDTVTCTLPAAWPNNIIAGVPIVSATDTVYVPMYNPSGGAVDPSSGTFIFSVLKH